MITEDIITLICLLGIAITGIVLLIENFKKNIGWGLASLFCGVPLLVFGIMNFKKVKRRFLATEKILVSMSFYFFLLLLFLFGAVGTQTDQDFLCGNSLLG